PLKIKVSETPTTNNSTAPIYSNKTMNQVDMYEFSVENLGFLPQMYTFVRDFANKCPLLAGAGVYNVIERTES
ncbi:MAG: hypothetical protein K2G58_03940, partial [Alistipes sp.]|nr:hypothetical protein [Alistipes sp.]